MRRIHRSDNNAGEIVKAARKLGMVVAHIGRPVDLLVGIGDRWWPVEIKARGGRYTKDQERFLADCAFRKLPVLTWRSVDEMVAQLNAKEAA